MVAGKSEGSESRVPPTHSLRRCLHPGPCPASSPRSCQHPAVPASQHNRPAAPPPGSRAPLPTRAPGSASRSSSVGPDSRPTLTPNPRPPALPPLRAPPPRPPSLTRRFRARRAAKLQPPFKWPEALQRLPPAAPPPPRRGPCRPCAPSDRAPATRGPRGSGSGLPAARDSAGPGRSEGRPRRAGRRPLEDGRSGAASAHPPRAVAAARPAEGEAGSGGCVCRLQGSVVWRGHRRGLPGGPFPNRLPESASLPRPGARAAWVGGGRGAAVHIR